jgi:hypothetical protein
MHLSALSLEQFDAQLLFQNLNSRRHARLSAMKRLACACHTAGRDHGLEYLQVR